MCIEHDEPTIIRVKHLLGLVGLIDVADRLIRSYVE